MQKIKKYVNLAFLSVKSLMKLKEHEINCLINDYYDNRLLIKDCMTKYAVGKSTVIKILKLFGTGGRKRFDYQNNKYTCDESYFEKINSFEKAYWFGFICADGNVYNGKLQIGLSNADEDHLLAFAKRLRYNGPIYHDGDKGRKLIIARKKIVQDLKNLGLQENKTHKIDRSIFDLIPQKYLFSAILGYIDGDGCFSLREKAVQFSLVGNLDFLLEIKRIFQKEGLNLSEPKKDKRTKTTFYTNLYLNKDRLDLFWNLCYKKTSKDFLKRKKDKIIYARRSIKV